MSSGYLCNLCCIHPRSTNVHNFLRVHPGGVRAGVCHLATFAIFVAVVNRSSSFLSSWSFVVVVVFAPPGEASQLPQALQPCLVVIVVVVGLVSCFIFLTVVGVIGVFSADPAALNAIVTTEGEHVIRERSVVPNYSKSGILSSQISISKAAAQSLRIGGIGGGAMVGAV